MSIASAYRTKWEAIAAAADATVARDDDARYLAMQKAAESVSCVLVSKHMIAAYQNRIRQLEAQTLVAFLKDWANNPQPQHVYGKGCDVLDMADQFTPEKVVHKIVLDAVMAWNEKENWEPTEAQQGLIPIPEGYAEQ